MRRTATGSRTRPGGGGRRATRCRIDARRAARVRGRPTVEQSRAEQGDGHQHRDHRDGRAHPGEPAPPQRAPPAGRARPRRRRFALAIAGGGRRNRPQRSARGLVGTGRRHRGDGGRVAHRGRDRQQPVEQFPGGGPVGGVLRQRPRDQLRAAARQPGQVRRLGQDPHRGGGGGVRPERVAAGRRRRRPPRPRRRCPPPGVSGAPVAASNRSGAMYATVPTIWSVRVCGWSPRAPGRCRSR